MISESHPIDTYLLILNVKKSYSDKERIERIKTFLNIPRDEVLINGELQDILFYFEDSTLRLKALQKITQTPLFRHSKVNYILRALYIFETDIEKLKALPLLLNIIDEIRGKDLKEYLVLFKEDKFKLKTINIILKSQKLNFISTIEVSLTSSALNNIMDKYLVIANLIEYIGDFKWNLFLLLIYTLKDDDNNGQYIDNLIKILIKTPKHCHKMITVKSIYNILQMVKYERCRKNTLTHLWRPKYILNFESLSNEEKEMIIDLFEDEKHNVRILLSNDIR